MASVRIYGRASAWTVAGVRVGASLLDVEQLNGRAFKLNYFEGEYGGDVIDWQGGRFDQPLSGGCRFGANFVIDDTVPTPDMDKEAAADRTLLSGGPGVRAAKPLVAALFVYFP
jgi:hypothetical protein